MSVWRATMQMHAKAHPTRDNQPGMGTANPANSSK